MFSNQNDEVLTETTSTYTVENTDYRIVVREMQRPDESIYFQVMVIDPDDKETDWIGPWSNQTKARYEGCKWAEDIYAEAQHDYAPDPDDEPTDRERAWNWIESKSRFTDPSGSYAWLWEGLDDSDLMHYSEWSVEDALSVQAPWIWDRLLADYETKTGEPCPLSQDDYAEFLKRSDYADALQAYKDRVQQAKPKLSEQEYADRRHAYMETDGSGPLRLFYALELLSLPEAEIVWNAERDDYTLRYGTRNVVLHNDLAKKLIADPTNYELVLATPTGRHYRLWFPKKP